MVVTRALLELVVLWSHYRETVVLMLVSQDSGEAQLCSLVRCKLQLQLGGALYQPHSYPHTNVLCRMDFPPRTMYLPPRMMDFLPRMRPLPWRCCQASRCVHFNAVLYAMLELEVADEDDYAPAEASKPADVLVEEDSFYMLQPFCD